MNQIINKIKNIKNLNKNLYKKSFDEIAKG